MARKQNIKEINVIPGGLLVDETDMVVGFTSRGVDKYFPTVETNLLTGNTTVSAGGSAISLNNRSLDVTNIGTRAWCLGGAAANTMNGVTTLSPANGQFQTFGATFEVAAEYDSLRLILVGAAASATVINAATAATCSDISTASAQKNDAGFAAPSAFLFNGAATGSIPIGTTTAPSLLFSDWLTISSIPRTDSGTLPLVSVRVALTASASAGATPMTFWGRGNGADWSNVGKAYFLLPGDLLDHTTGAFTGGYVATNTPIFGVQYRSKRGVLSTLWIGDSITASSNLTARLRRGFPVQSCQNVSTQAAPVEFAVAGFSGQGVGIMRSFVEAAYAGPTGGTTGIASGATNLQVLSPSHLMLASWLVNDATTATITDAQINTQRQGVTRMVSAALANRITSCLWNGIPRGNGSVFYDVTDVTKRQAYNADALTWNYNAAQIGSVLADPATPLGVNQYFLAANTSDGIHPSDTGDALITTSAQSFVQALANKYFHQ